jgi:UDP-N-acetylglucosamine--N-acetylmuramyl-(pentapeptide) pyrophosphoryl-undecaprenol N-acetylglucosamine transferase
MHLSPAERFVAIACGGTGGHLFPGIAIAEKLLERGCDVALLVSKKEVDQLGARSAIGMEVISLSAVPLLQGNFPRFLTGLWRGFREARSYFRKRRPTAVLAMGGFTSAAPILAAKLSHAVTALHESNSYAGRANRLLAPWVNHVFIGFSSAADQLRNRSVQFTGTPVRSHFQPLDPAATRMALGLDPEAPVVLVTGGSQGAQAINRAVCEAVPFLLAQRPGLQFLHLTGGNDHGFVADAYKKLNARAKVLPFLTEMDLALGAASVVVSRAGASSLAEIAAMQVPAILIPYPSAADDHQHTNARAFAQATAARMIIQSQLRPDILGTMILEIITDPVVSDRMKAELRKWHYPDAAEQIVKTLLREPAEEAPAASAAGVLRFRPG